jgi:hypothetical protein
MFAMLVAVVKHYLARINESITKISDEMIKNTVEIAKLRSEIQAIWHYIESNQL